MADSATTNVNMSGGSDWQMCEVDKPEVPYSWDLEKQATVPTEQCLSEFCEEPSADKKPITFDHIKKIKQKLAVIRNGGQFALGTRPNELRLSLKSLGEQGYAAGPGSSLWKTVERHLALEWELAVPKAKLTDFCYELLFMAHDGFYPASNISILEIQKKIYQGKLEEAESDLKRYVKESFAYVELKKDVAALEQERKCLESTTCRLAFAVHLTPSERVEKIPVVGTLAKGGAWLLNVGTSSVIGAVSVTGNAFYGDYGPYQAEIASNIIKPLERLFKNPARTMGEGAYNMGELASLGGKAIYNQDARDQLRQIGDELTQPEHSTPVLATLALGMTTGRIVGGLNIESLPNGNNFVMAGGGDSAGGLVLATSAGAVAEGSALGVIVPTFAMGAKEIARVNRNEPSDQAVADYLAEDDNLRRVARRLGLDRKKLKARVETAGPDSPLSQFKDRNKGGVQWQKANTPTDQQIADAIARTRKPDGKLNTSAATKEFKGGRGKMRDHLSKPGLMQRIREAKPGSPLYEIKQEISAASEAARPAPLPPDEKIAEALLATRTPSGRLQISRAAERLSDMTGQKITVGRIKKRLLEEDISIPLLRLKVANSAAKAGKK